MERKASRCQQTLLRARSSDIDKHIRSWWAKIGSTNDLADPAHWNTLRTITEHDSGSWITMPFDNQGAGLHGAWLQIVSDIQYLSSPTKMAAAVMSQQSLRLHAAIRNCSTSRCHPLSVAVKLPKPAWIASLLLQTVGMKSLKTEAMHGLVILHSLTKAPVCD